MDFLKKFFPLSFRSKDVAGLIISILLYLVAGVIGGLMLSLLPGILPFLGWLFYVIGSLIDIYVLIGIVIAILYKLDIVK